VKLLLPDGDVDFIVATPVIPDALCETVDIDGRNVILEATSGILAKKLLYRADGFKVRSVFDMSTVLAMDRASAVTALKATTRTRPALLRRLADIAAVPEGDLIRDVAMTGRSRACDGHGIEIACSDRRSRRSGHGQAAQAASCPPQARRRDGDLTWTTRTVAG
jgi:hypothetical protein